MGEARRRGDQQTRVAQAVAKFEELRPDAIICNSCQSKITDVQALDVRSVTGLDAAFAVHCKQCQSDTYALKGTDEAISSFDAYMRDAHGKEALIGAQKSKVLGT